MLSFFETILSCSQCIQIAKHQQKREEGEAPRKKMTQEEALTKTDILQIAQMVSISYRWFLYGCCCCCRLLWFLYIFMVSPIIQL